MSKNINIDNFELLKEFIELKKQAKDLDVKISKLNSKIKEIGKTNYLDIYNETGVNPETILIESIDDDGNTISVQYIVQDKYLTLNEEKANNIINEFGEGIIEKTTSYKIEEVLYKKYGDLLIEFINNSEDINDIHKENFIKKENSFSIKKGLIGKLSDLSYDKDETIDKLFEILKPVEMIKS